MNTAASTTRVALANFDKVEAERFSTQVRDSCGFGTVPFEDLEEEMRAHRIPPRVACVAIGAHDLDEARAALSRTRVATDLPVLLLGPREFCEDAMESDLVFECVMPGEPVVPGLRGRLLAMARIAESRSAAIESQRLAELGALVASISHELSNPLSYVRSNVSMALGDLGALRDAVRSGRQVAVEAVVDEILQMLGDTQSGVERVVAIVRDLRSMARQGSRQAAPTGLEACADSAYALLRGSMPAGVVVRMDKQLRRPVMAEPGRVIQVILNLMSNAIHACTPRGGTVTVRTRGDSDRGIVEIVDDGPGMDAVTLGRIFDPFFTTKPPGQGTGLGLPISLQFVREFGGELNVESQPGHGSRFIVSFPLAPS